MTARVAAMLVGLCLTAGIVALALRYHQAAGPLWRDEVTSVNVAAAPSFAAVIRGAPYDSFPLAWPIALHGWIAAGLGMNDAALRRIGLCIALALVVVVWWAGRRLGLDAPIVTLLLFGMSPSVLVYGGQVRGYGLGALAIAWCTGATWSFLHAPSRGRFAVLLAATVLAAQTYFANAFLVVALALGGAAATLPRRRLGPLAALLAADAVAAASVMLNLPSFTYALRVAPIEQGDPTLGWLFEVFRHALAPGVLPLSLGWIVAPALAGIGCVLAWRRRARATDPTEGELAAFVFVSATAALATYFFYLDQVARLATQYWYYLSLMALLALACDTGIALLARRWRFGPLARVAAVAVLALVAARPVTATVPLRMTNVDLVAAEIARHAQPADLTVVFPWYLGITFDRYYRGAAPWITLPDLVDHALHAHLEVAQRMTLGDAAIASELARVEQTLRAGGVVWVVGQPVAPPPGTPAPSLPPAPTGPEGWRAGPYLHGWELQLGARLQAHVQDVQRWPVPDRGAVNAWENVPLHRVRGWH